MGKNKNCPQEGRYCLRYHKHYAIKTVEKGAVALMIK